MKIRKKYKRHEYFCDISVIRWGLLWNLIEMHLNGAKILEYAKKKKPEYKIYIINRK